MPEPLATPTSTPTAAPEPTRSPTPTVTPVPTQSPEPKCRENFILRNGECICDRKNFVLRGGNCYPICGTEAATLPDSSICVCPDGYEKNAFGSCQKKCMKYAQISSLGDCTCDENFTEKDGKCICDEKTSDLIGDKCLLKPGKHEERIINGDDVKYRCKPGYDYDINRFCQKKEDGTINKKPSLWQRLFAKKPEQCYDEEGDYWFSRYKNGTVICRQNGKIVKCQENSCKNIKKRNKKINHN